MGISTFPKSYSYSMEWKNEVKILGARSKGLPHY
jgi:hypothetical protein